MRVRAALFLLLAAGLAPAAPDRADFVRVVPFEPATLEPGLATGEPEVWIVDALYEGLTYLDPKTLCPAPGVAERWDVSEDGRTWTFHLRANARWSNGTPVTAHDFVRSWRRVLTPDTGAEYAYMLWDIVGAEAFNKGERKNFAQVGVKARDARTLEVTLTRYVPYFLEITSFATAFPVYQEAGAGPDLAVTNGPFVPVTWKRGERLRLRKSETYWNAGSIALESADVLTVANEHAALHAFIAGDADWNAGAWPEGDEETIRKIPEYRTSPAFITYFFRLNLTRKPFSDPRVRRAIAMAIDRGEIVETVTRRGETPARVLVPPGMPGYDAPEGLRHDLARARALLEEAGYPGGEGVPVLRLLYNAGKGHERIGRLVTEQLARAGLRVELVPHEWQAYQATLRALDYEIARGGWIGDYLDPNTFLDMWITDGRNNQTGYASPLYDRLYEITRAAPAFVAAPDEALYAKLQEPDRLRERVQAARAASTSGERLERIDAVRMQVFREMERLLCEIDCPIVPVYFYVTKNLVASRVRGFHTEIERPGGGTAPNTRGIHPLRGIRVVKDG